MEREDNALKSTLLVKVHLEGFIIGRKIDVKAHDSYESLVNALCKMFRGFLSSKLDDEVVDDEYVLSYENHEGGRTLVADVPWKLFIKTVKKLYIVNNPKVHSPVTEDDEKMESSCSNWFVEPEEE